MSDGIMSAVKLTFELLVQRKAQIIPGFIELIVAEGMNVFNGRP